MTAAHNVIPKNFFSHAMNPDFFNFVTEFQFFIMIFEGV